MSRPADPGLLAGRSARSACGGRRASSAMNLWTSPSDRREPCGPCGQPPDNAKARCPPPDHTFASLAHQIHSTNNRILIKTEKTRNDQSGSM